MRRTVLLAAPVLAANLLASCTSKECENAATGAAIRVSADESVAIARVRSLVLTLSFGEERRRQPFDVRAELEDGEATIPVLVEPDPKEAFTLEIHVDAFREPGGQGEIEGSAEGRFSAAPNGCNAYIVRLSRTAGGEDAGAPAGVDGGERGDATPPGTDASPDAGRGDIDPGGDAGGGDAAPDAGTGDGGNDAGVPSSCATEPVPGETIALYPFEGTFDDATGAHPGLLQGSSPPGFGRGPDGCGEALEFSGGGGGPQVRSWGLIPDHPDWDLAEGSIDFWAYVDGIDVTTGILSRDSRGQGQGDLTLFMSCEGRLVVKLEAGGQSFVQCSNAPLVPRTWAHVAINFGPGGLELYLDGDLATTSTPLAFGPLCVAGVITVACGTSTTAGIAGSHNPWYLGASADNVEDGRTGDLLLPMRDGRIDSLRIRSIRWP